MKNLKEFWTPGAILILAAVLLYDHLAPHGAPAPAPAPAVNGVTLGKSFAPLLASTYADGWLAAAQALEDGKTVTEAQQALQQTWKEARVKAFTSQVAPRFSAVLPEGTEPTTPEHRARVVALWRAFAKGLRGGR